MVDVYAKSVGRNATLIIGITPDKDGLIPQADVDTLARFGKKIEELFGNPIASVQPIKNQTELVLSKGQKARYVVLREDLTGGQRVRAFEVQAKQKGKWQTFFTGSSIGNKLIIPLPENFSGSQFKLFIKESIDKPLITQFALY